MNRIAVIALSLVVTACSGAKPTRMEPTTVNMTVLTRSETPQPFSVTLRNAGSPSQRIVLSRARSSRSGDRPCPGGPYRIRVGATILVKLNRVKLANGRTQVSIDRKWMKNHYCPSLIRAKISQPSW